MNLVRVFKNVDCFISLHTHYLDKAVTLLFCNNTKQRCCSVIATLEGECCHLFQIICITDLQ